MVLQSNRVDHDILLWLFIKGTVASRLDRETKRSFGIGPILPQDSLYMLEDSTNLHALLVTLQDWHNRCIAHSEHSTGSSHPRASVILSQLCHENSKGYYIVKASSVHHDFGFKSHVPNPSLNTDWYFCSTVSNVLFYWISGVFQWNGMVESDEIQFIGPLYKASQPSLTS